jgi:hypothetical protein
MTFFQILAVSVAGLYKFEYNWSNQEDKASLCLFTQVAGLKQDFPCWNLT